MRLNQCVCAVFTVVFVVATSLAGWGQVGVEAIRVTGIGRSPDGECFAIVRGGGLMSESDVVRVTVEGESVEYRVLEITLQGIQVERVDPISPVEPEIPPEGEGVAVSRVGDAHESVVATGPRDPFVPVMR